MTDASPKIQALIDRAVSAAFDGQLLKNGLRPLEKWIEMVRWDELLEKSPETIAVEWSWISERFSDAAMRDMEGLDPDVEISDEQRVMYAIALLANSLEEPEDFNCPSLLTYPLVATDGRSALLGCICRIHGQGGPHLTWHGAFLNQADFHAHLLSVGFISQDQIADISAERILDVWHANKGER